MDDNVKVGDHLKILKNNSLATYNAKKEVIKVNALPFIFKDVLAENLMILEKLHCFNHAISLCQL